MKLTLLRLTMPLAARFPGVFYGIAWIAGWIAWKVRQEKRRAVISNLLPACDGDRGRARQEGLKAMRNVARYYVDLATLRNRDLSTFERDHMTFVHEERMAVLGQPGPVIIVSAHAGDPELAVQALSQRGRPFVALVEALPEPGLLEYLVSVRSRGGGRFYAADFGGVRECLAMLQQGGVVALVADRDMNGAGMPATFFGRCVKFPKGPWEMARRTGATVLPMFSARRGLDDMTVFVEEPFTVSREGDAERVVGEAVQRWAEMLERNIRREPGQWSVLEDFFRVHACG